MFGTFNDLTLEFAGLAPGAYRVVTYAVVGQSATTFDTEVWLQGDTGTTQVISGEWSGAFALGASHSEHTVDLSNGLLRIDVVRPADAVLNAVQVILIPAPGAGVALLSAGLLGLARRRR